MSLQSLHALAASGAAYVPMYMRVHHLSMHRAGAPSELMSLMGRHCSSYSPGSTPSSTSPSKGMISCMHS